MMIREKPEVPFRVTQLAARAALFRESPTGVPAERGASTTMPAEPRRRLRGGCPRGMPAERGMEDHHHDAGRAPRQSPPGGVPAERGMASHHHDADRAPPSRIPDAWSRPTATASRGDAAAAEPP